MWSSAVVVELPFYQHRIDIPDAVIEMRMHGSFCLALNTIFEFDVFKYSHRWEEGEEDCINGIYFQKIQLQERSKL